MIELWNEETTGLVLKAFFDVYNRVGYGFLERVYENCMAIRLRGFGLNVEQQYPIQVRFEGLLVGEYAADLLVQKKVLVEVKSARALAPEHEAQLLNYLAATPIETGLLLNFGPKAEYRRRVMDNRRKAALIRGPD